MPPIEKPSSSLGAEAFVDLDRDRLEDIGEVDMVFDVIGGQILCRSAALVRSGGTRRQHRGTAAEHA